MLNNILLIVVS